MVWSDVSLPSTTWSDPAVKGDTFLVSVDGDYLASVDGDRIIEYNNGVLEDNWVDV